MLARCATPVIALRYVFKHLCVFLIMAGSLKDFVYTADDGATFAIERDESNTEAVNGANSDFLNTSSAKYRIPSNLKPREAVYQNPDKTVTRKCVCLTQTIYNGVFDNVKTITDQVTGETLSLVALNPEKIKRLPKGNDTGLTDGDDT